MSVKEFTAFVAILMSIVAISIDALLPAFSFIASDLNVSDPNKIQLVISALFLGLAMGQLVCGPLSDAFGRKPVLYVALAIYFIGTAVCYFSNSIEMLLAGRWIQGLGVAGPNIAAVSLVRDSYKGREMAKIMSLVMMVFIMVPTLAPALGQLILLFADWRSIFILYAVYGTIILTWVYYRLDESLPKDKRIPFKANRLAAGFREVLSNRSTTSLMVCMGLVFGCLIGYINSCQQIIQVQFGAGKMFSVYFGMLALLLGVSSLFNSRFVERLGMHFIASRALLVIAGSSLSFLVIQQFFDVRLWMFLLYAATLFGSFGLIFGNLNAMAMEPMGHLAGIASAVIGSTSSLMSITIGTIIGQLYDGTVAPITTGALLIAAAAWALLQYANRQKDMATATV
ncbi:multidrug effflux MFS transporter [Arenicella xantha]|uniref:Bcr/CflA family efflux transporter n=1 Tax=Arenicella xantha TaxID=644221 RepID=A0A395JNZ3_9GAMM|nr:multidrug effflux MFS transporter [Arenicella xantha]RBP51284.1 DHA1 family bicyclomycin/chloramphenicol resistance-like MFS transporter [Arenicella xantha]